MIAVFDPKSFGTDRRRHPMQFEPQEDSNRPLDLIVLRLGALALRLFGTTVLLESAVVGLYRPVLDVFPLALFRISVCGVGSEYPHEAKALNMCHAAFLRNVYFLVLPVVGVVQIDRPAFFQFRQVGDG